MMPARHRLSNDGESIGGTLISHNGPSNRAPSTYGPLYNPFPLSEDGKALGCEPRLDDKVYLTVTEIVAYGIVERPRGQRVTVEEVSRAIDELGLEDHGVLAGQKVYDPIPIRVLLSPGEDLAALIESYSSTSRYGATHVHLASILRGRIRRGQGGALPKFSELISELAVSNGIVRRAVRLLVDSGVLVDTGKTYGRFVAADRGQS